MIRGSNGVGKTSILEAVGYVAMQQSFRRASRDVLVRDGTPRAVVRSGIRHEGRNQLVEIKIEPPRRDVVQWNRQRDPRRMGHDPFHVTVFTPDDLVLVKGGPAERRRFLDDLLVAAHPSQHALRHAFERALRQRNVLLRQAQGRETPEVASTLEIWDAQLAVAGAALADRREELVAELAPAATRAFARLAGSTPALSLRYERSFSVPLDKALVDAHRDDLRRGVSTVGPHHDELAVAAGDLDARSRLSQGRQRAATLALRLAAHEVVGAHAGHAPVLLLDDVFSELDDATARSLRDELPPGQTLLTTAGSIPNGADVAALLELTAP